MLKSLNQIKSEFALIASDHRQINNYYFGGFLDAMKLSADDGTRLYKYLIITPISTSQSERYTATNIEITICDVALKGYEDKDDIQSDCVQILNDIYTTFFSKRWQQFVDIESDGQSRLFHGVGPDHVTGASMQVNLKVFSENNQCAIPYETGAPLTV